MGWSERTCRIHGMKRGVGNKSKCAERARNFHADREHFDGTMPTTIGNVKRVFTGKRFVIRDGKKVEL